jgi:hypothetical protein
MLSWFQKICFFKFNLYRYIEGELDVLTKHVDNTSVVLALHGCNEANKVRAVQVEYSLPTA